MFSYFVSDLIVYQTRRTQVAPKGEKIIDEWLFEYDQMQLFLQLPTFPYLALAHCRISFDFYLQ